MHTVAPSAGEKIVVREVSFEEFCDLVLSGKLTSKELVIEVLRMLAQGKKEELKTLLLG
jgi:hypothetical protein